MDLSNVKGNFDAPAQLAYANIVHRCKGPVQKPVRQINVPNHLDQPGHAYQSIDLAALVVSRHLDFEIVVDIAGCVL